MTRQPKRPRVPDSIMERAIRMALERGRLAHLLVDQGSSRGAPFLLKALDALLSLPPAQKAQASEQVKSRFVRFVLRKR